MQELRFFAELPEGGATDDEVPTRVQLARTGKFVHPRYGRFQVTRKTLDAFIANFEKGVPTPELAFDFDHTPDKGGPTRACGWIRKLEREGDKLFGRVEWTAKGAEAVREREYRFISPTWVMAYVDDEGTKHGPTIVRSALTNSPFFSRLAPVVPLTQTFAREFDPEDEHEFEDDGEAETFADSEEERERRRKKRKREERKDREKGSSDSDFESKHPRAEAGTSEGGQFVKAGSSGEEAETVQEKVGAKKDGEFGDKTEKAVKDFQKKHGLKVDGIVGKQTVAAMRGDKDAKKVGPGALGDKDKKFLRGAGKRTHERYEPSDSRRRVMDFTAEIAQVFSLPADAEEDAVITAARDLVTRAEAGDQAVAEARTMRFDVAFDKAVDGGRVKPADKETYASLFEKDEEGVTKILASAQQIVAVENKGARGEDVADVPEGSDPENFAFHQKVQTFAAEHNLDYGEALDRVLAQEGK